MVGATVVVVVVVVGATVVVGAVVVGATVVVGAVVVGAHGVGGRNLHRLTGADAPGSTGDGRGTADDRKRAEHDHRAHDHATSTVLHHSQ